MAVAVDRKRPDFTLTIRTARRFTLSTLGGQPVGWRFRRFSSVCTKELCTFKDSMAQLGRRTRSVFGISVDTFFALKAFQDQQKLTFPLLSISTRPRSATTGCSTRT